MLSPTIPPRPAAQIIDLQARRIAHPDSVAAMLRFETQRAAHLARRIGEADPESCLVRRAIVRRAGDAIARFRRPESLASGQSGSAL